MLPSSPPRGRIQLLNHCGSSRISTTPLWWKWELHIVQLQLWIHTQRMSRHGRWLALRAAFLDLHLQHFLSGNKVAMISPLGKKIHLTRCPKVWMVGIVRVCFWLSRIEYGKLQWRVLVDLGWLLFSPFNWTCLLYWTTFVRSALLLLFHAIKVSLAVRNHRTLPCRQLALLCLPLLARVPSLWGLLVILLFCWWALWMAPEHVPPAMMFCHKQTHLTPAAVVVVHVWMSLGCLQCLPGRS